jgi:hypothetical protein
MFTTTSDVLKKIKQYRNSYADLTHHEENRDLLKADDFLPPFCYPLCLKRNKACNGKGAR